jgi:hypothetical protein
VFELRPHLAVFILHRLLPGHQKAWAAVLIEKLANSLDDSALGEDDGARSPSR